MYIYILRHVFSTHKQMPKTSIIRKEFFLNHRKGLTRVAELSRLCGFPVQFKDSFVRRHTLTFPLS